MQFVYFSSLFSSSPVAIRQSLWIGLSYSPFAVLIRTFRTWLSSPGYVSTINAIFHWDLLCSLSSSRTRLPTLISSLVRNHLFLGKRFGAKYLIQQFQKSFILSSVLLSISLGLIFSSDAGFGGEVCDPISISLGVIGGLSQTLTELGYKSRLLIR